MEFSKKFKLKSNPFRVTPASNPNEIVWAGFPEIKSKFERRIKRSIKIPNSSLILNWGEYGSGKTHAARYFSKNQVLENLSEGYSTPYSIVIPLPKGKEPVNDIFTSIIDKLKIDEIRLKFEKASFNVNDIIVKLDDNLHIQNVLKAVFNPKIEASLIKKYLYGNATITDLKELKILRKLKSDSDFTKFISNLFSCLTYNKELFSTIIFWIDEFEDIAVLNNSNIDKINNFLREILDNTPNNLLIFINLTQTALIGTEDLGQYIYESVRSRIKERNNFELPTKDSFEIYLKELLKYYRTGETSSIYFPFEKDTVDYLISKLENVSIRRFNDAFSILIEIADMDDADIPITKEFLRTNESDIIWDII